MAKWIVKAAVQKALAVLPYGHRANVFLQKHVTKSGLDDAKFEQALSHCVDHIRHLEAHGGGISGATTLELGTGWYPVVPLGLYLCGAKSVTTVDLTPWMTSETLSLTARKFRGFHPIGGELPGIRADRLKKLMAVAELPDGTGMDAILEHLGIRYLVADAQHLPIEASSIDLIHSNNVLEHIYPDVLEAILMEFERVAAPNAVMSHFIDMTDHFSHSDTSIGRDHFLRFSEAQWKLIDNSIAPQSRLRLPEYRTLFERAGIPITEELPNRETVAEPHELVLSPRFEAMPKADVSIRHAYLISRLAAAFTREAVGAG